MNDAPRLSDVAWCNALSAVLSMCCASPSLDRIAGLRTLLAAPPVEMLPDRWVVLRDEAKRWLERIDHVLPPFWGARAIEQALADMPVPVPAWANRYERGDA